MDVSSEDDFWQWGFHLKKKILPPNNEGDKDIDEDSGDENELLPKNQTEVKFSTVDLSTSSGNILLSAGVEEEVAGPLVDVPSNRNKESKVNSFLKAWHLADVT